MVTYSPGDMSPSALVGSPIGPADIVGTNPVLSDDSDGTYVEFAPRDMGTYVSSQPTAEGPLPPIASIADVSLRVRAEVLDLGSHSLIIYLSSPDGSVSVGFGQTIFGGPGQLDSPTWITPPLTSGAPDLGDALAGGGNIEVSVTTSTGGVATPPFARVYEVRIDVTPSTAGIYPLTRYPRAGVSGPNRARRRLTRRPGNY